MNLNIRVAARAVANVDGWTYGRTNGQKTGSIYRAMPEAGATKRRMDELRFTSFLTVFQSYPDDEC